MSLSFLIIDDRELDCFIAQKLVTRTNLSKSEKIFNDATSALNYVKENTDTNETSVILLDLMMPVMNGFQFIEHFENLSSDIKNSYNIIAVTTSLNNNDINRILTYSSVIGVLKKPYTEEHLIEKLKSFVLN